MGVFKRHVSFPPWAISSLKCQLSAPRNSDLLLWTKMSSSFVVSMFLEYLMSFFANYL